MISTTVTPIRAAESATARRASRHVSLHRASAALVVALCLCALASAGEGFPAINARRGSDECVVLNPGRRLLGEENPLLGRVTTLHVCTPFDRAFGDVDGDGRLDLIDATGIYRGHGDGVFGVRTTAFVGSHFGMAIAAGDLNRDGFADLVLGTLGIRAYFGRPDGTVEPFGEILLPFQAGGIPPGLRLSDLDGDGDLDLLGNSSSGPFVAFNRGVADFERTDVPVAYTNRMTICDLDGDGLMDLVSVGSDWRIEPEEYQIAVFIYRVVAPDILSGPEDLPIPGLTVRGEAPVNPGVTVGDIDRDGDLDIVSGAGAGRLALWRAVERGEFPAEPELLDLPEPDESRALILTDFDRDGLLDLAVGYRATRSRVYWGLDDGFVDFSGGTEFLVSLPSELEILPGLQRTFVRGDADDDGGVNLTDAVAVLEQLFFSRAVVCGDASDADDSGRVDLVDALYLLNHVAGVGPPPPEPYPEAGGDFTGDFSDQFPRSIPGDLGCSFETFNYRDFAPCDFSDDPENDQSHCRNPVLQRLDVSIGR